MISKRKSCASFEIKSKSYVHVFIDRLKQFIPTTNDPLLELDRNARKFELCLQRSEPVLHVTDLKQFLLCTCNLDPYLNKLIRGFTHSDIAFSV